MYRVKLIMIIELMCLLFTCAVEGIRVCKTDADYLMDTHGSCWDSTDHIKMPELLTQYGYRVRTYSIVTSDGYILKLFRLPRKKPKGRIYLLHPGSGSAANWVDKQNASLGIALYNAGYDIWLGNMRGSPYSRAHISLNPDESKFWDFSYHEIGVYDIPATINFIKNKTRTNNKITFIGHSMAGTAAAIYASLFPKHAADRINLFILIAPGFHMKYIRASYIKAISSLSSNIYLYGQNNALLEIVPPGILVEMLGFCRTYPGIRVCNEALNQFVIGGFNNTNTRNVYPVSIQDVTFSASKLLNVLEAYTPIFYSHIGMGMSLKAFIHYLQHIKSNGTFTQFDYGEESNIFRYNSTKPPAYPLKDITSKMFVMVGTSDNLSTVEDMRYFMKQIPKTSRFAKLYIIEGYGHVDYIYSATIEKSVNIPIVNLLANISNV